MVEPILEIEKRQPIAKDASRYAVRVHYGEHLLQMNKYLLKKQTNSYKLLLVMHNYYLIELASGMKES